MIPTAEVVSIIEGPRTVRTVRNLTKSPPGAGTTSNCHRWGFVAVESRKKSRLDAAARRELQATIKFLAKLHEDLTGKPPTTEELIETLRERGQHAEADELERVVAMVRERRSGQ